MLVLMAMFIAVGCGLSLQPQTHEMQKYPRVNMAIGYEVDFDWPSKPKSLEWGMIPGVAVDAQDRVWIITRAKVPVQAYDVDGWLVHSWGEGMFESVHQIEIDHQQNVWIADSGDHVVQKFTPEGKLLMTLGIKGEAGVDEIHLNKPTDMVIGPAGDIFVVDGYGNHRIVHFDKTGKFIKTWGQRGTKEGEFYCPHAVVLDSEGKLFVADRNNVRVQLFNQEGQFLEEWRNLLVPWGMCITDKDEIWVCGSSPMRWRKDINHPVSPPKDQLIMKFSTDGKILQLWVLPMGIEDKAKPEECVLNHGIAVDSKGNIYFADVLGKQVKRFTRKGYGIAED